MSDANWTRAFMRPSGQIQREVGSSKIEVDCPFETASQGPIKAGKQICDDIFQ